MTTEQKQPGMLKRAEGSARRWVLQLGLGVAAFVLGSIFSSGASSRLGERLGPFESETLAFLFSVAMQRLWLVALLPAFGWAFGRFSEGSPLRFALTAGLSGEVFHLLLLSAMNGFESLWLDVDAAVIRLVTLLVGMALTVLATGAGRRAAAEAQQEANAIAEKQRAEYAAYLAEAEKK